jgi:hypothetical protein
MPSNQFNNIEFDVLPQKSDCLLSSSFFRVLLAGLLQSKQLPAECE